MQAVQSLVQSVHHVPNGDGWLMAVKQTYAPARIERKRRPIAIVPGYGMNAFIFGYHPTGKPMEIYWAEKGFEVWSVNLRAQDGSIRTGGRRTYGFYDAAVTDLDRVLEYIVRHTATGQDRVDGVGCSLGGTYLFVYLACLRDRSRLGAVVAIGAPLRLKGVHPVLKAAFGSPRLAGKLSIRGVRPLARLVMPVLKHLPILHMYLHPAIVDTSKMNEMIKTVENPNPLLNREIAEWIRSEDLIVRGVNVTQGVALSDNPLLVVLSNADGIVPEASALSAYEIMGSTRKDILRVGTPTVPVAHADLFVSNIAQEWVFEPLARWLAEVGDQRKQKPRKAAGRTIPLAGKKRPQSPPGS
ncbi:MAG: alpha/beta fold hydrolase [bacterium]